MIKSICATVLNFLTLRVGFPYFRRVNWCVYFFSALFAIHLPRGPPAAAGGSGSLEDWVRLGAVLDVFGGMLQGNVISVKEWDAEGGEGSEGSDVGGDVTLEDGREAEAMGGDRQMEVEVGEKWTAICHTCRALGVERPDPMCAACSARAAMAGQAQRRGILKTRDARERQRDSRPRRE